ncbi:hypothetical protein T07_2586 [Trichinella nelsoni]|uniref:Uncharacterized protein n=1 Tax=Trichinella nelsoni TaxID=6336 RepID=A0A0V0RT75_9BILA|nr:hypothetical protein T07_2586 [Trichinella nelsoni]
MDKYGEQTRPKHTLVSRYVARVPPGPEFFQRKRQTSRSSSCKPTCDARLKGHSKTPESKQDSQQVSLQLRS